MLKKKIWNLIFNIILICLEVTGLVLLIYLPLNLYDTSLPPDWSSLKYYTTLSNLLLLFSSSIVVICLILELSHKIDKTPQWVNFFKLMSTSTTTLTMCAVLLFAPFSKTFGYGSAIGMFQNSNTFYHLLAPLWGIVTYLLFENKPEFNWPTTLYTMIPTALYAIAYMAVALTHVKGDGSIPIDYDWYCLSAFGVRLAPIAVTAAIGFSYLACWCLWYGNRKIVIKSFQKNKDNE